MCLPWLGELWLGECHELIGLGLGYVPFFEPITVAPIP